MTVFMQLQFSIIRYTSFLVKGWLYAGFMTVGWCLAMPSGLAAEKVNIRLGPFQQSVEVGDLEKFAKTGKLPDKLQVFSSVLTPQARGLLTQRLQVDPKIADRFFDSLMKTSVGKQLISSLGTAIPGSSPKF